jgi:hypothetical protein
MHITTDTLNILKNFSKINASICIDSGDVLKTISSSRTIMAKAKVDTNFPKNFAIYNIDRFISTLSLFSMPTLEFKDNYVEISDGKTKSNYTYADESTLKKAPDKTISLPSVDANFEMTYDQFKEIERAAGVLGLPEISITGDGSSIYLKSIDSKNPSGDIYSIEIGETTQEFNAIFKLENINKILSGTTYEVSISSKGISQFSSELVDYWIAVEHNSTF